ncbi:prolyl oligopeptidase family serine peptidase [Parachitinimonas caeni]|uniref:Prolyl oligopeptidase family serine peptidase n=1 Tax=Parachitinimonas caeni TaxID=3031301 RepID=A0ABT7E172_9NEIS|nr:prolyl oligopeptidase family serine peptidase [Parachitinimonas caeni]MDK2125155.1 prolyl oligopeptidase family serine peptidase [Parachitinimonas caeni]
MTPLAHPVLISMLVAASLPAQADSAFRCSEYGAPPMQTVEPVTKRPKCLQGQVLSYDQDNITRYACLNTPKQVRGTQEGSRKWPLLIYLHGSRTTPDSLYLEGHELFELHNTYPLSPEAGVEGFLILSPEGRRAKVWPSSSPTTGEGFHWDEWYRNPKDNLDVQAIDHFLDEVMASGWVDPKRVYVFGWSNGAYMAALYASWRRERIAAVGQYAGANPWSRPPCPVALPADPPPPLTLMRNLCDALVPCTTTNDWIKTQQARGWTFEYTNLDARGRATQRDAACTASCGKAKGIAEHVRWPGKDVLTRSLLEWFKGKALP